MSITTEFIQKKVENQSYEMFIHADDERLNDELTIEQIEFVLKDCEIIETYSFDPRGESCLVCGKNSLGHLFIITVYIPTMPKWLNPRTRNQ
ncbi:MAG: DUF4258 domain-containing protein [Thermodesulfobacteriota bacterium]|nr:DUF4258 domain-containing protein [Thermodesulfobacteriota bacterium]